MCSQSFDTSSKFAGQIYIPLSLSLTGHTANRRLTLSALSARRLKLSISNQIREAEQEPVQMDPLCSHSTASGTTEVPPKGAAGAEDRQGSRRRRRRPKEEGQGVVQGAAGGANGQSGRYSGPMSMHFLFGKQKVQQKFLSLSLYIYKYMYIYI